MEDYIGYIIAGIIGIYIGFKANELIMRFTFKSMIEEAGLNDKDLNRFLDHYKDRLDSEGEYSHLEEVSIRIEQHSNTLYAFRKDTDEFIGQGATKEDLICRMGEKLRDVKLVITPEDGAELIGGSFNFDINTKEIKPNS